MVHGDSIRSGRYKGLANCLFVQIYNVYTNSFTEDNNLKKSVLLLLHSSSDGFIFKLLLDKYAFSLSSRRISFTR